MLNPVWYSITSVIGLVVKFSVAIRAASGSPGFDSQITQGLSFCLFDLKMTSNFLPNAIWHERSKYDTIATGQNRSQKPFDSCLGGGIGQYLTMSLGIYSGVSIIDTLQPD